MSTADLAARASLAQKLMNKGVNRQVPFSTFSDYSSPQKTFNKNATQFISTRALVTSQNLLKKQAGRLNSARVNLKS